MKVAFPQRDGQVLAPWEGVGPRCVLLLQPAQQNRPVTCRFFTRCLAKLASECRPGELPGRSSVASPVEARLDRPSRC